MRTFKKIAAQGDVMIMRVDSFDRSNLKEVAPEGNHLIVTHSETGHHHVLDRNDASMFENPDNELEAFLTLHRASELTHLRDYDTHESLLLEPGDYRIIRQREYTPEGYRRVQD